MVRKTVGYASFILGSFAILVSSLMLLITIVIPFIGETIGGTRGITAMAIMDTGGVTLGYYGYTLTIFIVMLSLGIVTASIGRYIFEKIEEY